MKAFDGPLAHNASAGIPKCPVFSESSKELGARAPSRSEFVTKHTAANLRFDFAV